MKEKKKVKNEKWSFLDSPAAASSLVVAPAPSASAIVAVYGARARRKK